LSDAELKEMGIFLGSTSMDIPIYEAQYNQSEPKDYFTQSASGFGTIADNVARHFNIDGPCHTFTTACTSSANGLLYAASLIQSGELKRALVIGYDRFNKLGFYGFESLKLLSATAYRPFDKNRDGIIMGEACGVIILDSSYSGHGGFRILGGANVCDTHNVALHNTDGDAVVGVMAEALTAANLTPQDIVAVKAHATGSYHNDLTEACAIRRIFGSNPPPVTGLKPYVGHTVGASGVTEMVLFTEAISRGFIPATPGFQFLDEELALAPITENRSSARGPYMLNYFGFGGNCTTLIVANTRD
jgi:3-oxoacyl-(acyl-carrier-protein) synthase